MEKLGFILSSSTSLSPG